MSAINFLKELGLHKDPDVQKRLAEIEEHTRMLKNPESRISPKTMDQIINGHNEYLQSLAVQQNRPELTEQHLETVIDKSPIWETVHKTLHHPKLSSEAIHKRVQGWVGPTGFDSSRNIPLGNKHNDLDHTLKIIRNPNTSGNTFRELLPKHEKGMIPIEAIETIVSRKNAPSDVLHSIVTMPEHKILDSNIDYEDPKLQPMFKGFFNTDDGKHWTHSIYRDIVHHPNVTGQTLETMVSHISGRRIRPTDKKRYLVPLASHPNATDDVLKYVASQPNRRDDNVVGLTEWRRRGLGARDFETKYKGQGDSHTAVARHPNASSETLAKLIRRPYETIKASTLQAVASHPNAHPKTVAAAKAELAKRRSSRTR